MTKLQSSDKHEKDRPAFDFENLVIPEDALETAAILVATYDPEYDDPRKIVFAILGTILRQQSRPMLHEKAVEHHQEA